MTKQKKFSLTQIKNDIKKYSEKTKITFSDNTYLHINKYFSPTTLVKMYESYGDFIAEYGRRNIGELTEAKLLHYFYLHIIKFFSSLSADIPDDFDSKIQVFDYLSEHEYTETIINSYDQQELTKAFDKFAERTLAYASVIEQNNNFRNELREKLQKANIRNKELIDFVVGDGQPGSEKS